MFVRTCLAVFALSAGAFADVGREGTGPRRDALNQMELTAFDTGLWGKLSEWTGGEALDASRTGGQVVLVCTWSSWYQPSIRQGLSVAQKAFEKFGGKGLIVVGVHHQEGWAEAAAAATAAGVKFPIAHDAKNAVRDALKVDQDPDFYLIDRAGHLRYADIATASVEQATAELVAETKEQASDLPGVRTQREAQAKALAAQNQTIRTEVELNSLPAVPPGYEQPAEEVYQALFMTWLWPREARENPRFREAGLVDQNGVPVTTPLNIAPDAFPAGFDPSRAQGRVIVVYLWHPDLRDTYDVFDYMDRLQRQSPRDLLVVGACTPRQNIDPNQNFAQNQAETVEELERKFNTFKRSRNYDHTIVFDPSATAALSWPQSFGGGANQTLLPRVLVASSDGTVRFFGSFHSTYFRSWLDRILHADPGVAQRRLLDEKYLRERNR